MSIEQAIEILKKELINTYAEGKAQAINTVLEYIKKLEKDNDDLINMLDQNYPIIY